MSGYVPHGESSVFDLFGGSKADIAANNYQICMNQNHGFDSHVQGTINSSLTKLNSLLRVRQTVMDARVRIMQDICERVVNESSFADLELKELYLAQQEINTALEENHDNNKDSEAMNFLAAFQEYNKNQVHNLQELIRDHEAAHVRRNTHYNRAHLHSRSDGLFNFRE